MRFYLKLPSYGPKMVCSKGWSEGETWRSRNRATPGGIELNPSEQAIAPEKCGLEDHFPIRKVTFQGLCLLNFGRVYHISCSTSTRINKWCEVTTATVSPKTLPRHRRVVDDEMCHAKILLWAAHGNLKKLEQLATVAAVVCSCISCMCWDPLKKYI